MLLYVKLIIPKSKIEGYKVLTTKSIISIVYKIFMLLIIAPISIMFILAIEDNIKVLILIKSLGVLGFCASIYLLIGIIYYFTQPRILIYENEDTLLINKKYLVNIKDITLFNKKDILVPESSRSRKTVSYWGTIKIVVDDKKFVIRNVSNPLETVDYLYRKKKI